MIETKKYPKRKTIRLHNYNYSRNGLYFVTICTQNRIEMLGEIIGEQMILNNIGEIIDYWLNEISIKFPDVKLDVYQIMPNHIHIIIIIESGAKTAPLPTLGQIIAYFKYQSTKQINSVGAGSSRPISQIFQRNYYEHIIRDQQDLEKIRIYIKINPQLWSRDRNNPRKI